MTSFPSQSHLDAKNLSLFGVKMGFLTDNIYADNKISYKKLE